MASAQPVDSSVCGCRIFSTPSNDGEHRSQGEQHDRHHEAPEVALAPVPERMRWRWATAASAGAPSSSSSWLPVSATECTPSASIDDERVKAKPTNLASGDAEVGEHRGQDRALAAGRGHGAVLADHRRRAREVGVEQAVGDRPTDGQRRGGGGRRRVDDVHQPRAAGGGRRARVRPRRRRSRRAGCRRGARPGPARRCPPGRRSCRLAARAPAVAGSGPGGRGSSDRITSAPAGAPVAPGQAPGGRDRTASRPRRPGGRRAGGSPGATGPAPRWARRGPSRRGPG